MAVYEKPKIADFPEPLKRAVIRQAQDDADNVALFLGNLFANSGVTDNLHMRHPADLLFGLAAALRLLVWEGIGLREHLTADLPTAMEAIGDLFNAAADPSGSGRLQALARGLHRRVFSVWLERFAWDGPELLGTDLLLGDAEEDALADELARFAWSHRHGLETWDGDNE